MLKNELTEKSIQDKYGMDEWLFDLAARAKARADVPMHGDGQGRAPRPLAAAWDNVRKAQRREDAHTPKEPDLHQHRVYTLGLLSGGLAHDLNNMLTIIINNAAIAMLQADRGEPVHESIEETLKAAESARKLTGRILNYGRNQAFSPRPTNINELIDNMLVMMKTLLPKNVHKRIIFDPQLPLVNADPEHLTHALMNLVTNAIDAMPEGGMLSFSTRCAGNEDFPDIPMGAKGARGCHIQITDTGPGIPINQQSSVFDPFFTTKPDNKGCGLGLHISKTIIEEHGGRIKLRNHPQCGVCLDIFLPFS